jgi:hypothetical protein
MIYLKENQEITYKSTFMKKKCVCETKNIENLKEKNEKSLIKAFL